MNRATLNNQRIFNWENQARQYPRHRSGITYFKGVYTENKWVDCLLYYEKDNELQGILNHYPFDVPPYQKAGSVNLQVRFDRRRKGIATALLEKAVKRFNINIEEQEYTPDGERLIKKFKRTLRIKSIRM